VLLVFGAPCQLRSLAGQEHGRTIPLADLRASLDCGVAVFGDLRQAAVMPSPYATNKANLIEMLTYCRARA